MADIKIDMVKPIDLPQMAGPLSILEANYNDMSVVKYPSDLGTTQGRNTKNHWVSFRIYDVQPAGIRDAEQGLAKNEAVLAISDTSAVSTGVIAAGLGLIAGKGVALTSALGAAALSKGFSVSPPISSIKSCISLYMPDTLTATYDANYEEMSLTSDLGPAITTLRALNASIDSMKKGTIGNSLSTDPNVVQAAVAAASAVGVPGVNVENIGTLLQRAQGFALNPQLQMVYRGTGLRSFQLSFTFTPKSATEATQVNNIINQFRFYSSPSLAQRVGTVTQSTTNSMFLVPPSVFEIEFYVNGQQSVNLPRYGRCVMTGLDINHAPNGFAAYDDSSMVQTTLQMSFKEMDILTRDNFNDKSNPRR